MAAALRTQGFSPEGAYDPHANEAEMWRGKKQDAEIDLRSLLYYNSYYIFLIIKSSRRFYCCGFFIYEFVKFHISAST